jgi:hypothetical protein
VSPLLWYPPVDFRVFGLGEDWGGARWLAMIEGSSEGFLGLVLAHGDTHQPTPGHAWASVSSLHRPHLARYDRKGRDSHAAAQRAVMSVLDATEPKLSNRERTAYRRNMVELLFNSEATRYLDWPRTTWIIDDQEVEAHTFSWADAWSGFAISGDVAIVITAGDLPPDNLRLETQTDGLAYHFDLRQPLAFPDSIIRSQELAAIRDDEQRSVWPRHRDHETLLMRN